MRRRKPNKIKRAIIIVLFATLCALFAWNWKMTHWKRFTVTGYVYDAKGTPVAGAIVLPNLDEMYVATTHRDIQPILRTDVQGRFDYEDVPGQYTLFAQARNCTDRLVTMKAHSGQTVTTRIVMQPDPYWQAQRTMFSTLDALNDKK